MRVSVCTNAGKRDDTEHETELAVSEKDSVPATLSHNVETDTRKVQRSISANGKAYVSCWPVESERTSQNVHCLIRLFEVQLQTPVRRVITGTTAVQGQ